MGVLMVADEQKNNTKESAKMASCKDCVCSEVCYYKAFNDEKNLKKRSNDVEKICKSFVHRDSVKGVEIDPVRKEQVEDILAKWEFFYGQRAGRELWAEKLTEVQDKDIENFCRDLSVIRSAIVEVVRCKDCKHRGDDVHCPMCFEEEIEWDDDGYTEADYVLHDRTIDDGFCDRGERREGE